VTPGPADVVDGLLELPVAPSFTRVGPAVRSRLDRWTPLDSYDLTGRVIVLTGPTSGLGLAAAEQLARCGATLVLVGRDRGRTEAVRDRLASLRAGTDHHVAVADLADLSTVRDAAEQIRDLHPSIDALLHNAGALTADRRANPDGIEATVASQVVGPFLLTTLLLESLRAASPGRVITMASGGMYASGLTVANLQMSDDEYRGAEHYARAKRAQVTLNEMWAERLGGPDLVFHAVHPGWADTPGVRGSLPRFHLLTGPLLRTPEQGADTMVWLAADDGEPLRTNGAFWLDRRRRALHRLPTTRRTDTPERREQLRRWVSETAGVDPTRR
jgi:NAD(P)-dependent dehydrogenase (short-subunit alcohol dehydrogenase family)